MAALKGENEGDQQEMTTQRKFQGLPSSVGVFGETGICLQHGHLTRDKYAYRIPNPKHTPKYTKAKVPHTQDKHTAEQLGRALLLPYKKPYSL